MRHLGNGITTALIATLVACGGDATGPAAERNDPGTGTTSLRVAASISAADAKDGFVTKFEVSLWDAQGLPVSDATVTIQNGELGEVNLLEVKGSGVYRAKLDSFPDGDFRLDVVSGDDRVENVVVGGIGIHEITAPQANSTVTAGEPLTVSWDAPALGRSVEIETRDYESGVLADNGSAVIPAENNVDRDKQRIRVYRTNSVDIVGALPDSELELRIRNTVEPIKVAPAQ